MHGRVLLQGGGGMGIVTIFAGIYWEIFSLYSFNFSGLNSFILRIRIYGYDWNENLSTFHIISNLHKNIIVTHKNKAIN